MKIEMGMTDVDDKFETTLSSAEKKDTTLSLNVLLAREKVPLVVVTGLVDLVRFIHYKMIRFSLLYLL